MDLVDNTQLGALSIGTTEIQVDGDLSALFGIELAGETTTEDTIKPKEALEAAHPKPVKPKVTRKKKVT